MWYRGGQWTHLQVAFLCNVTHTLPYLPDLGLHLIPHQVLDKGKKLGAADAGEAAGPSGVAPVGSSDYYLYEEDEDEYYDDDDEFEQYYFSSAAGAWGRRCGRGGRRERDRRRGEGVKGFRKAADGRGAQGWGGGGEVGEMMCYSFL